MILSFAWTSAALLAGRKTCTCRDWSDDYARRFKAGDIVKAYDRSPRFKGTHIADLRLTHYPVFGSPVDVLDSDIFAVYEREGFAWYDEQAALGNADVRRAAERGLGLEPGESLWDYLEDAHTSGELWGDWVIRFEPIAYYAGPFAQHTEVAIP